MRRSPFVTQRSPGYGHARSLLSRRGVFHRGEAVESVNNRGEQSTLFIPKYVYEFQNSTLLSSVESKEKETEERERN